MRDDDALKAIVERLIRALDCLVEARGPRFSDLGAQRPGERRNSRVFAEDDDVTRGAARNDTARELFGDRRRVQAPTLAKAPLGQFEALQGNHHRLDHDDE